MHHESFNTLIAEAEQRPVDGWDFSWLGDRLQMTELPWNFAEVVGEYAHQSPDLLDLGTGGGEWLTSLTYRPQRTVATEAWPPNVPVAVRRLEPLGIEVVPVDKAPLNNSDAKYEATWLPFEDDSFHLIMDRHEAFVAREVARVLAPGGRFVTQQVGDGQYRQTRQLFNIPARDHRPWTRATAISQLEEAGLAIERAQEAEQIRTFADVGALAWYLRMVPWEVPGFSIEAQRDRLAELHDQIMVRGPIELRLPSFYVVARKRLFGGTERGQ